MVVVVVVVVVVSGVAVRPGRGRGCNSRPGRGWAVGRARAAQVTMGPELQGPVLHGLVCARAPVWPLRQRPKVGKRAVEVSSADRVTPSNPMHLAHSPHSPSTAYRYWVRNWARCPEYGAHM